jgi:hypothetical protein
MTPSVPSCSRSRSLVDHVVRSAWFQTQYFHVLPPWGDSPVWMTSGRRSRHLAPLDACSESGSTLIGSIRLLGSVSLLAVSSLRHRDMSFGLKMRAAEVGMVFWKKLRSSTFMARFTGGANMSLVASVADIGSWARGRFQGGRVGLSRLWNYFW